MRPVPGNLARSLNTHQASLQPLNPKHLGPEPKPPLSCRRTGLRRGSESSSCQAAGRRGGVLCLVLWVGFGVPNFFL